MDSNRTVARILRRATALAVFLSMFVALAPGAASAVTFIEPMKYRWKKMNSSGVIWEGDSDGYCYGSDASSVIGCLDRAKGQECTPTKAGIIGVQRITPDDKAIAGTFAEYSYQRFVWDGQSCKFAGNYKGSVDLSNGIWCKTPGTNTWYGPDGKTYCIGSRPDPAPAENGRGKPESPKPKKCQAPLPGPISSPASSPASSPVSEGEDEPKCDDNREDGNNASSGDPIHFGTGNVFYWENDGTQGAPLSLRRYYNSQDNYSGPLGNWRIDHGGLSLQVTEVVVSSTTAYVYVRVYRPDGSSLVFRGTRAISSDRFTTEFGAYEITRAELKPEQGTTGPATGFRLEDGKGRVENYDRNGRLLSITDGTGTLKAYVYDTNGRLTTVVDRFGNQLSYAYNADNRIESASINGQLQAMYGYDANGRLVTVTRPDSTVRRYEYNNPAFPNALSRIVNENNEETASWDYDAQGRGIRNSLAPNRLNVTVTYNADGTVTESFANGLVNTYTLANYNGYTVVTRKQRVVGGVSQQYLSEYDPAGRLIKTTDWNGNITAYDYDPNHRLISRTDGVGTPQERTTTYVWQYRSNLLDRVITTDTETVFTYQNGRVATRTEFDRSAWGAGSRAWAYTYNAAGQLESVNGSRVDVSDITTYAYNGSGRLASVTNALGQATTFSLHDALGLPGRMTDANGVVTNFTWDARGRLQASTLVDPQQGALTTTYSYDGTNRVTGVTLPDGSGMTYEYDAAGELAAVEDATGARIEYERDAENNVTRVHVRNSAGVLVRRVEQAWNEMRRLTTVVGMQGVRASYTYDANGNRLTSNDGLNHTVFSAFNALDRLVQSTDALNAVTALAYDTQGNLSSVTDPRGLQTSYEYDGFGCLRRLTSPDTGVTLFTCDAAGNVSGKTDARNISVTYGYDALNRRTGAVYSGFATENASFGYDSTAGGNAGVGRLTSAQNDGATVSLRYDARGNVVSDQRTIGGIAYTTAYTWDDADRLERIDYPTGRVVTYVRNAAGEVTAITTRMPGESDQVVASAITREPFGPLHSLIHGNGLTEMRQHDGDGFLTQLTVGSLLSRAYARDAAGRITQIGDSDPQRSETYGYDNADRLTGATGPYGNRSYTYDGVGNRLSQAENGYNSQYTYGATSNRLYQVSGHEAASLDYDAAGNTTAKGDVALNYNAANRMAAATVPGANGPEVTAFAYTALGERVIKSGPLGTTHFHYDRHGRLLAETDATGAAIREYIWLSGTPVAMVAKRNAGTTRELFHVHADHLDTALILTDATQQVVWRYNREPFGELTAGNDLVAWPLRFPGQYEDVETGYRYNYFRDYDATISRYVESDPIGLRGGINTYAYVRGSPVVLLDPFGLASENWSEGSGGDGGQPIVIKPPSISGNDLAENIDGSGIDMWTPSWSCTLQCPGGDPIEITNKLPTQDSVSSPDSLEQLFPGQDQLGALIDRTDPEDWLDCP